MPGRLQLNGLARLELPPGDGDGDGDVHSARQAGIVDCCMRLEACSTRRLLGPLQGALILLLLQCTRQRLVRQMRWGAAEGWLPHVAVVAVAVAVAALLALQQNDANADDYHRYGNSYQHAAQIGAYITQRGGINCRNERERKKERQQEEDEKEEKRSGMGRLAVTITFVSCHLCIYLHSSAAAASSSSLPTSSSPSSAALASALARADVQVAPL